MYGLERWFGEESEKLQEPRNPVPEEGSISKEGFFRKSHIKVSKDRFHQSILYSESNSSNNKTAFPTKPSHISCNDVAVFLTK